MAPGVNDRRGECCCGCKTLGPELYSSFRNAVGVPMALGLGGGKRL